MKKWKSVVDYYCDIIYNLAIVFFIENCKNKGIII